MKKIYLIISVLLVLLSCDKDEDQFLDSIQTNPEKQSFKSSSNLKYVEAIEIPKVLQVLESHFGKSEESSNVIIYKSAENDLIANIDLKSILEVVNSKKKTNYTFPLNFEGQPENEFYNVIIHKTASGKIKKPYVKRFRLDPDALENYIAHNRDFKYFKGTYSNHWFEDFFKAFNENEGKFSFKTVSTCDDDNTIGGGGTYNSRLIDVNNNVTWTGLAETGYGRALGTWNHYGGTGGYDLNVSVRNNSSGYREVSTVSSITSNSVVVSDGYSSLSFGVNGGITWMDIFTETTGSSGGSTGGPCSSITIIRGSDGGYTIEYSDCLSAQKSSQSYSKAYSGCPEDDGEVGIIDDSVKITISKRLGLQSGSPDHIWLSEVRTTLEQQQINNLKLYFDSNPISEKTKQFGWEVFQAIKTGGEVDFVNEIVYTSNMKECAKDIIKKMLNNKDLLDLGDMPDFVKRELNLSGVILDFFNKSNGYNLIFDSKVNLVNIYNQRLNARTRAKRDTSNISIVNFTITLDSDYLNNATDLVIARTIIHEALHAYLSYIYHDQIFNDLSNSLRPLLNAEGAGENSAHHIFMTQQFMDAISNSLESWDDSRLANKDYYDYLSWSGDMLLTAAFDDLDGNTQTAIKKANFSEGSALSSATSYAQGTKNCINEM